MYKTGRLFLSLIFLLSASTSYGHVKEGQFTISPLVGGYTFEEKQHLKTNPIYGIRLGYNISNTIGVEGAFDYSLTKSTLYDKKIDFFKYGADVLYNFMPQTTVVPYLAIGYNAYSFYGPVYLVTKETKGAFDYGAGLKLFLNDDYAVRADVRHVIASSNSNLEYTLGVLASFGGSKPASKSIEQPAQAAEQRAEAPVVVPVEPIAPPPPAEPVVSVPVIEQAPPAVAAPVSEPTVSSTGKSAYPAIETPTAVPVEPAVSAAPPAHVLTPVVPEMVVGKPISSPPAIITGIVTGDSYLEIVINGSTGDFKSMTLAKPSRLIIDFATAKTTITKKTIAIGKFGVAKVRVGVNPSNIRVVLESGKAIFPPYLIKPSPKGLRIYFK